MIKHLFPLSLCLFFLFPAFNLKASPISPEEKLPITLEQVDLDLVSETLGHLIVRHLSSSEDIQFNIERIIKGIENERLGKPSPLTEEEYEQSITLIQENLFSQIAEKNLSEADLFLKQNIKEECISAIEEKLQYQVLQEGNGEEVSSHSSPLIHYTGKLINGTVFANSREMGEPVTLSLRETIAGFSKGLIGMKEGEKRVLYVHPDLAYGESGHLPPNSLLIFEVEVIKANQSLS